MILKYYPVCECGYVFKELKCTKNKQKIKEGYTVYSIPIFSPNKCPKCGKIIEGLEFRIPC